MFLAWKAARAVGVHSWVKELYGREPEYWTSNLSALTLELMIEEQRQEQIAMKSGGDGKMFDADVYLKMSPIYPMMRKFVVRLQVGSRKREGIAGPLLIHT